MSEREVDVIIFGATGFTGKNTVLKAVDLLKDFKWGIAGRSQEKLEKVLAEVGKKCETDLSKTPIFIAKLDDDESLKAMASKCKVLINCVGPYRLYGEPVVKACIEAGTHQVDVTGEPQWMERMALEYNEKAKEKGSFIVSACGFDSVPADMGVVYLERHFEGTVNSVEQYFQPITKGAKGPTVHYGTWASLVHGVTHWSELAPLRKKLYPTKLPKFEPVLKDRGILHKSDLVNKWCLPFLGADKSVIYRSQRYFYETEKKRPVQIKSYVTMPSMLGAFAMMAFGILIGLLTRFSFGRYLLLTYPGFFSFGTVSKEDLAEEDINKCHFVMHFKGQGWTEKLAEGIDEYTTKPDKDIYVRVKAENIGYGATCVALVLCAKMLMTEKPKLPKESGVFTPAAVFAKTTLIEQLSKNGWTFEVVGAKEETKE
ncbi:saccharopine dehydrogenase-like oxidoreductase [Culicoides brevitarsis]|uniref:saccharopine dehydrogenase-like oxidoreductase n=1 Tax=Culicoides brevitarsis TaxID=469753 RepID=UPI00307B4F64